MMMCVNCKCGGLTWANARQSCARMASRGLPPDEAKARSPSCGKCATAIMRELGLPSPLPRSSRRPRKPSAGWLR